MPLGILILPEIWDVGFPVEWWLSAARIQSVGPFVFFDYIGPVRFAAEDISALLLSLATITWLYLGSQQLGFRSAD